MICARRKAVSSVLWLANLYMNRFLKHWRFTGCGEAFRAEPAKYFVMLEADHIVGLGTQFGEAVRGGNGHREHEPLRMAQAGGAQCGPGPLLPR